MDLNVRTEELIAWGARIGSAALILIIGFWLAFSISRFVRNKAEGNPRIDTTLGTFLSLVIRYALIVLVVIVVLQQFGVQTTSLVAVVGASALPSRWTPLPTVGPPEAAPDWKKVARGIIVLDRGHCSS